MKSQVEPQIKQSSSQTIFAFIFLSIQSIALPPFKIKRVLTFAKTLFLIIKLRKEKLAWLSFSVV
jgi:hypothetical protein